MQLALCAGDLSSEANLTREICYKLLLKLPSRDSLYLDYEMQINLLRFSQMVKFRNPGLTAAGIFPLQYDLILRIVGGVVSNVVILLQFDYLG